jgi:hypothetical protein
LREENLVQHESKKTKKSGLIANSSTLLDLKTWVVRQIWQNERSVAEPFQWTTRSGAPLNWIWYDIEFKTLNTMLNGQ